MQRYVLVLLLLLVWSLPALAEPKITGFTNDSDNGAEARISGTSFGSNEILDSEAAAPTASKVLSGCVVLGDSGKYEECQNRLQLDVSVWREDQIDLKFQVPDSLQAHSLYLYVLDSEGIASSGFGPLEYGKAIPEPVGPGVPGQPKVQ